MMAIGLLDISLAIQVKVFSRTKINSKGQSQDNLGGVINKLDSENRRQELM